MAPFSDGQGGVTRFGHHGIGGTVCNYDGPPGSWTWSVSGDQLTLTSVKDLCGDRRAIWEGPGLASARATQDGSDAGPGGSDCRAYRVREMLELVAEHAGKHR